MRIILVGSLRSRAKLRPELDEAGIEIAAECRTLTEARESTAAADAIVLADRTRNASDDEWIEQPLTKREIEVLQLLAEGLPNKSIADRLGISDQTVKFHLASIFSKLGASNRTEAVRLGLKRGMIDV
jgi:DNA-binding NarL/FixJ family response regulator